MECPMCSSEIEGYAALSRKNNATICSDCARDEAMEEFFS